MTPDAETALTELAAAATATTFDDAVARLLAVVRTQLGMEIAWLSEFIGPDQVLRYVDATPSAKAPPPGTVIPMSSTFCSRVLDGRFPPVIPDSRRDTDASLLNASSDVHIGSYVGVPLVDASGIAVGMLCTISDGPTPGLAERDVASLRLMADLLRDLQRRALSDTTARSQREQVRFVLRTVIDGKGRHPVLQPIVDLTTGRAVAAEGLTRFTLPSPVSSYEGADAPTLRSPAQWFDDAHRLGLRVDLELAAAAAVLDLLDGVVPRDASVAVNVDPDTVMADGFVALLRGRELSRVIVELTEHSMVRDYEALADALEPYRAAGLRVAVDDAGAGYASLRHVLAVEPDYAKIDMALVRGADRDPVRRTLLTALTSFADSIGCRLVAEGVETAGEMHAVHDCGIRLVQGYLLSKPSPSPKWSGFPKPRRLR